MANVNVVTSPYAIVASAASGGTFSASDYTTSYTNGNLNVTPRPLTYSVADASSTYGTPATVGAATFTNVANNDVLSPTVSAFSGSNAITLAAKTDAGSYNEAVTALNNSNYMIAATGNTNGTLTINPLALTLSGTRTYDSTTMINASVLSASNVLIGDSVTLTGGAATVSSKNVGTYNSFAANTLTTSSPNYTAVGGTDTATITPALLTISSLAGQPVYGSSDPASAASAYSITSGNLFGSDALTGTMYRAAGEGAGHYNFLQHNVAVSDGNNGNNYTVTFNGSSNPFQIVPYALALLLPTKPRYMATVTRP